MRCGSLSPLAGRHAATSGRAAPVFLPAPLYLHYACKFFKAPAVSSTGER